MSKQSQKMSYFEKSVSPRENCYTVFPLFLKKTDSLKGEDFQFTYNCLGLLGYRIRETGYCAKKIVVSLNKRISDEHRGLLGKIFEIKEDKGHDLGFC